MTAADIIRRLAEMDPSAPDGPGWSVCVFCGGIAHISDKEIMHSGTCLWTAAVRVNGGGT